MTQQPLFYEDIFAALRATCIAIAVAWHPDNPDAKDAWAKIVGHSLFPSKSPSDAAKYFANCLDGTRNEKLDIPQILWIVREGGKVGCHLAKHFIDDDTGYERSKHRPQEEVINELEVSIDSGLKQFNRNIELYLKLKGEGRP